VTSARIEFTDAGTGGLHQQASLIAEDIRHSTKYFDFCEIFLKKYRPQHTKPTSFEVFDNFLLIVIQEAFLESLYLPKVLVKD